MKKLLLSLSGARPEILEHTPSELGKFEGIGGAVLTTSMLASVSMTFALYSALDVSLLLAVPAGLVWGMAILSLDRWLVTTIRADAPRRWRLAIPRILMAMFLGVVISTPLVLQIFKPEIDAQIVQIKQQRAHEFAIQQKQGILGKEIEQLRQEVAALQKVILSGGDVPLDPEQDPKIQALTRDRDKAQKQAEKHYKVWECQLYGGPACPKKGDGPLARDAKRALDKENRRIDQLTQQIEDRKQELSATGQNAKETRLAAAKAALPSTQEQLDAALKRQSDLRAAFDAENITTDGLLIRLKALNEASEKDATLKTTQIILILLFLLIECLPVTVKLMQRPGSYEKVLAVAEIKEFRDARFRLAPAFPARHESSISPGDPREIRTTWQPLSIDLPDVGGHIDLLDVGGYEESPRAAVAISEGLEELFRRLGPPPDDLQIDLTPQLLGDGGAGDGSE